MSEVNKNKQKPTPPPSPKPRPSWTRDYMEPQHRVKHIPQDNYCNLQDTFMAEHQIQNLVQLIAYIKGQLRKSNNLY